MSVFFFFLVHEDYPVPHVTISSEISDMLESYSISPKPIKLETEVVTALDGNGCVLFSTV